MLNCPLSLNAILGILVRKHQTHCRKFEIWNARPIQERHARDSMWFICNVFGPQHSFNASNMVTTPFQFIKAAAFRFPRSISITVSHSWPAATRRRARLRPLENVPSRCPNVSGIQAVLHRQHRPVAERVLAKVEVARTKARPFSRIENHSESADSDRLEN